MPSPLQHPGLELAEKIKASGFRQAALAQQLGVPATSFNEMLHGKRDFPADLCVRMQAAMGYGRELWRKQAEYHWQKAADAETATRPA